MRKPLTAYEMWQDFSSRVISRHAPEVQKSEMKKAFYAGMFTLLIEMKVISEYDEETASEVLSRLDDEVKAQLMSTMHDKENRQRRHH